MGVHNISQLVQAFTAATPPTTVPPNSRILIDGSGLCFHLLNNSFRTSSDSDNVTVGPLARHHNGDYDQLSERVKQYIAYVRDHLDLAVEVWWDGPKTKLKQRTHTSRKRQRAQQVARHKLYCEEGILTQQDDLPPPPLFTVQVRHTLTMLGVYQVRCEYEADPDMARDSAATKSIVVGNDSDFLFFQGCRYVSFQSGFGFSENKKIVKPFARILTRSGLAKHYGTDEHTLVEWALFLGNDFTGPFVRLNKKHQYGRKNTQSQSDLAGNHELLFLQQFDGRSNDHEETCMPNREEHDPESLLYQFSSLLHHDHEEYDRSYTNKKRILKSEYDPLEKALLFSRAYYNHGDMSHFEDDESNSKNNNNSNSKNNDHNDDDELPFFDVRKVKTTTTSLGAVVLQELRNKGASIMSGNQRLALQLILEGERRYYDHREKDEDGGVMRDVHLKWDDVAFCYLYQKSCKRLMSVVGRQRSLGPKNARDADAILLHQKNAPSSLFHGPTFHILMQEFRDATTASTAPTTAPIARIAPTEQRIHDTLPIDDHKERILQHIASHKVRILAITRKEYSSILLRTLSVHSSSSHRSYSLSFSSCLF